MSKASSRTTGKPIRVPEQSRSRASMEKLLDIGREIIARDGIDACNMSAVAAAAGSSVGSLYFRFGNRERFIAEVMERQIGAMRAHYAETLVVIGAKAAAPREVVEAVIRWIVRLFARNHGLLRAQLRRALDSPDSWGPFRAAAAEIVDGAVGLLERFPELAADHGWQSRLRIAMQMIFGTLINILINRPGPLQLDDRATARELATAAVRYLRWDEPLQPAPRRRRRRDKTTG